MQISSVDRSIAIATRADNPAAVAPSAASAAPVAAPATSSTSVTVSTAATGTQPVRAGVTQPEAAGDYLDATPGARGPDTPSADSATRGDWVNTLKELAEEKEAKEKAEIKPPLFELLIEQFNSLWRASAQAVDATTQTQGLAQANRQAQLDNTGKSSPLVYTDPSKVRKTSSTPDA